MEFTKEQTNIAKGVAICLMFANHLFGFKERLVNGNSYIPLIPVFNAEVLIGYFGNVCVSMFLFLSGYGMYLGYLRSEKTLLQYSAVKLANFYLKYWLYFLIFIPIGLLYFNKVTFWDSTVIRYSPQLSIFLENLVGWRTTYNEEWWFVWTFGISLAFLFPLYTILVDKSIASVAFVSLLLWALSSKVDSVSQLGFAYWQPSFAIGIICAKSKFFSSPLIKNFDKIGQIWIFAWILLCFILRLTIRGSRYDFLMVPFLVYFSCRAVTTPNLSKLFAYLGKYSFPLWLSHSFFCYYYFQNVVYFPRWSPLVFILLTTMSLLTVLAIETTCSYLIRFKSLIQKRANA